MLQALLLLFVAIAGPWVVHLAPVRQRLMALVGFIGVLLLWLVFENWIGLWWFWAGLIGGIVSVAVLGGDRSGPRGRPHRPPRPPRDGPGSGDLTEEISPPVS
jgi:hypothetical protein